MHSQVTLFPKAAPKGAGGTSLRFQAVQRRSAGFQRACCCQGAGCWHGCTPEAALTDTLPSHAIHNNTQRDLNRSVGLSPSRSSRQKVNNGNRLRTRRGGCSSSCSLATKSWRWYGRSRRDASINEPLSRPTTPHRCYRSPQHREPSWRTRVKMELLQDPAPSDTVQNIAREASEGASIKATTTLLHNSRDLLSPQDVSVNPVNLQFVGASRQSGG